MRKRGEYPGLDGLDDKRRVWRTVEIKPVPVEEFSSNKWSIHFPNVEVNTPTRSMYMRWVGILGRCLNTDHPQFKNYGARGISVCRRWVVSFRWFLRDLGTPPFKGATIDRIDNNGNYEPGNVRWATWAQQASNRRQRRKTAT